MALKGKKSRFREFYPLFFWFVLGSCLVFICLLVIMTKTSLDRQERFIKRLLTEKGEALIRSYEAGARAGAVKHFGPFERQKLVIELAREPGVDYIIITNEEGQVVADSEPFRIGGFYALDMDRINLKTLSTPSSRRVKNISGADTFEVFRALKRDASFSENLFIFVGLDMGPILEAHRDDVKHTVMLALVLFLVGITALTALFFTYRYRATRSSLEELRLFSHYLLERLPIGVVSLNREDKVTLMNEAASRLLHLSPEQAKGLPFTAIFPPAVREGLSTLKATEHRQEREVSWKDAEGKEILVEIMASRLEDGGTILLLKDLSELKTLREELERSRTLAAIGNLAAGVAHEIRNPLSSLKGFATYFKEKYGDDADVKEVAGIMIEEIERLNRVITQLLNLARPASLKKEHTDLKGLVDQSIKTTSPEFDRQGVQIINEVAGTKVYCDPDQMKQVFINLFLNALAATDLGGKVTVEAEELSDNRVLITISDTGCGIKPTDLPRVFDPFFTTKSSGTGLGLTIVHKVIEAHGGEVHISSTPGEGTKVKLTLPKDKRAT
ncbi:MAG TPA: ATP-binding protein [Syntrophales bacterium]|nr:ATP-binding protein [Syntrophales bacterium]HOL59726.1 ATP-binding protein [Syntrophales bacterium]HPO35872.1 ATP-binding protein [Syntrophales bacterium]